MPPHNAFAPPVISLKDQFILWLDSNKRQLELELHFQRKYGSIFAIPWGNQKVYYFTQPDQAEYLLLDHDRVTSNTPLHDSLHYRYLKSAMFFQDGEEHRNQRKEWINSFRPSHFHQHFTQLDRTLSSSINTTNEELLFTQDWIALRMIQACAITLVNLELEDNDPLLLLIRATAQGINAYPKKTKSPGTTKLLSQAYSQMIEQLSKRLNSSREEAQTTFSLLFAAIETSTSVIITALHQLLSSPQLQRKFNSVLDECGPSLDFKQLSESQWLKAFYKETLRWKAPLHSIARTSTTSFSLDGFVIPENSNLVVSIHSIHNNANYWSQPEEFIPDRFLETNSNLVPSHRFAWLPFGTGAHKCLGMHLFRLLAMLMLTKLWSKVNNSIQLRNGYKARYLNRPLSILIGDLAVLSK